MFKLKLFSSILVVLFLSTHLHAQLSNEQSVQNFELKLPNSSYQLQLSENQDLLNRVKISNNNEDNRNQKQITAKHYSGKISGHENSWYRISKIGHHWIGLVSLDNTRYVIDVYSDVSPSHSVSKSKSEILAALPLEQSKTNEPVHCGVESHEHANSNFSQSVVEELLHKNDLHSKVQNDNLLDNNASVTNLKFPANLCTDFSNGICLIAEIEFIFDELFQNAFSSTAEAQQEALAMINIVEGFYVNDFEIKFDTLTLEFLNSPIFTASTDSGDVLDDLRIKKSNGSLSFLKNSRALTHLVTGRDFDGSTAGVAFVGVLCNSRNANVGTSQLLRFGGSPRMVSTALVVAHELGHNFGASHDGQGNTCGTGFIMSPSVSSSFTNFSSCSIETISADINSISNKSQCFNFPTDLSITANPSNPNTINIGQTIVTDYEIQVDDSSFQQATSINVNGVLPSASGSFQNVSLNNTNCSVDSSGSEYTCNLTDLTPPINLRATSIVSNTDFQQTHTVSVADSLEIVDVNASNDSVVTSFTVSAAPPNSVTSTQATIGSGGNSVVVNLTWQDNSNNEDGFVIERSENSGNFSQLVQLNTNVNSYTDSAVTAGTVYTYRIIAFNSTGNANPSNTTEISLPTIPSPVTGLEALANVEGTNVTLNWLDNSDNEDGFLIQRSINSGSFSQLVQLSSNVNNYIDTSVNQGTNYSYRILAFNIAGSSSDSNIATVTTGIAPAAATELTAIATATTVEIMWNDNSNNETGFLIQRNVGAGDFSELTQVASNTSSYIDMALTPGESYGYRVIAFNATGSADFSNTANVTIDTIPNTASGVSASLSSDSSSVSITWQDESANENGFVIERNVNSGSFSDLVTLGSDITTYTDSSVSAGTTYSYRVRAFNAIGDAELSNEVSVTTAAAPAPTPTPTPTTPPAEPPASSSGGGGSMNFYMLLLFVMLFSVKFIRVNQLHKANKI